jgi:hypothetical protein
MGDAAPLFIYTEREIRREVALGGWGFSGVAGVAAWFSEGATHDPEIILRRGAWCTA